MPKKEKHITIRSRMFHVDYNYKEKEIVLTPHFTKVIMEIEDINKIPDIITVRSYESRLEIDFKLDAMSVGKTYAEYKFDVSVFQLQYINDNRISYMRDWSVILELL